MSELKEIIKYRNRDIRIYYDDIMDDEPGSWYDGGYLIYDHKNFRTAPRGLHPSFAGVIYGMFIAATGNTIDIEGQPSFVFPVFAYIHGDISLYLQKADVRRVEPTGFDTSMKGFAVIMQCEEIPDIDKAYDYAETMIKSWNEILSGEVYRYETDTDSCGSYVGKEGYNEMIEQAKAEIDYQIKLTISKYAKHLKKLIKSDVPICYRKALSIQV